jgi:hypothetical protein
MLCNKFYKRTFIENVNKDKSELLKEYLKVWHALSTNSFSFLHL